jgi:predicted O-methyltransferase YrrM
MSNYGAAFFQRVRRLITDYWTAPGLVPPFHLHSRQPAARNIARALANNNGAAFTCARRIRAEKKSMLAPETLAAIYSAAAKCDGPIIEIGAYVGGATLAILDATRARGNTVISIEFGVAYDHPEVATADSIADLLRNVESWGLSGERHIVLPGWTLEAWIVGNILIGLSGARADMLVVDSDGFAERDFLFLHPLLNDGAILVFDDYMPSANAKSDKIAPFVDDMLEKTIISEFGLLSWGTWFGQLKRRPSSSEIAPYVAKWRHAKWPWIDFLDLQRREQHLARAKELKVPLLPFQFTTVDDASEMSRTEVLAAYARVKAK